MNKLLTALCYVVLGFLGVYTLSAIMMGWP